MKRTHKTVGTLRLLTFKVNQPHRDVKVNEKSVSPAHVSVQSRKRLHAYIYWRVEDGRKLF